MGTKYIVLIQDRHSRWIKLKATDQITSEEIVKTMKAWIAKIGLPKTLLTDQGRQFISNQFQDYLKTVGIKYITTTA